MSQTVLYSVLSTSACYSAVHLNDSQATQHFTAYERIHKCICSGP